MNKVGIYPGTFDPITYGHIDVIKSALKIVNKLIVAVSNDYSKEYLFSAEERVSLIKDSLFKDLKFNKQSIKVLSFNTLTMSLCKKHKATVIFRGLRVVSDFEYEFQLAGMNRKLDKNIETVFLMSDVDKQVISSKFVKEIAKLKGKIDNFLTKSTISTAILCLSKEPIIRYHFVINPDTGGTPIILKVAMANAAIVHGIFLPMPSNWLISVLCDEIYIEPAQKNSVIFENAWFVICIIPPIIALGANSAAPKIIYESWLMVENASRALRLSLLKAKREAMIMVKDAKVITKISTPISIIKLDPKTKIIIRSTVKTPVLTTATAWSSALTGVGATIAAGNHPWNGIIAHLANPKKKSTNII